MHKIRGLIKIPIQIYKLLNLIHLKIIIKYIQKPI